MALGFAESKLDSNLYFKVESGRLVMLLLYVDDLFLTGKEELIRDAIMRLAAEFEMKDLDMMHYFPRMEVWQNADGISLGQGNYAVDILKRLRMMGCKAMTTPMASNMKLLSDSSSKMISTMMYYYIICSLMFLVSTLPNTCFAMNNLI